MTAYKQNKKDKKVFIIAEISANHGQRFDRAVELIRSAKSCGADAVKFQAYTPDTMTIDCDNEYFQVEHPKWGGQTLYHLYKNAYTPWEWFPKLKKVADNEGILFFATAFDKSSVDMLEQLNVSMHKISSFELTDLPLIEYIAKTKKPIIISVGMASIIEIKDALNCVRKAGVKDVTLLKCTSSYPANPKDMNLNTIPDMIKRFKCNIGLSDHSMHMGVSLAAVALGARVVEKHFTLSRKIKTEDSFFSIEPHELKELVGNIRVAEQALGRVNYQPTQQEKSSQASRRSLFIVKNMKKGDILTRENLSVIRPGMGLLPKNYDALLGKRVNKNIERGTPVAWSLIA